MSRISSYLRSIRWFEISLRMGEPTVALLLTIPVVNSKNILSAVIGLVGFFFCWAHGYTLNEWGGYESDRLDPRKSSRPIITGSVTRIELLTLSIVLAVISVVIFFLLKPILSLIVVFDIIIGVIYCHPRILGKTFPFFSLFALFIVSVNDFLLGWLIFSNSILSGITIGVLFGLLGLSGISYHEAGDYEYDRREEIMTNAVRYGQKVIFIAGFFFYILAVFYIVYLSIIGLLPNLLYPVFLITFPIYTYFFLMALRTGLDTDSIHNFIRRYRYIYVIIGIYMVVALAISRL